MRLRWRPFYLEMKVVLEEVGLNAGRDYANWGGEFVDDAFRSGEQPFQISDALPGQIEELPNRVRLV